MSLTSSESIICSLTFKIKHSYSLNLTKNSTKDVRKKAMKAL
jgi:hypothetical protein